METNISIDEKLYEAASLKASKEGVTINHVVERALREFLAQPEHPPSRDAQGEPPAKPEPYKSNLPVFRGGKGPMPGVNINSRRELYDFLDDDYERLRRKGR